MRGPGDIRRIRTGAARWLVLAALVVGVAGVPATAGAATSWWTDPSVIGTRALDQDHVSDIVVSYDGRPIMVLGRNPSHVRVRMQSSSGAWKAPTTLFAGTLPTPFRVLATEDATYAVWAGTSDVPPWPGTIGIARLDGNRWTPLVALPTESSPSAFDAAPSPEGGVAVVWSEGGSAGGLRSAMFDGTGWSAPTSTPRGVDHDLALAVTESGTRLVLAHHSNGLDALTIDGGVWSAPHPLSSPSHDAEFVQIVARTGCLLRRTDVGLTTGVGGSDEFQPNRSITRAEAVTTLWRLVGEPTAPPSGFEDAAPNAFYSRAVNWARHAGLTTGVGGSNRFEPNRDVTRAEAFTFVYRLATSGASVATTPDLGIDVLGLEPAVPLD